VGLDEIPQPELSITNQSDEASSILPPSCQLVSPFPCFMGFRRNFSLMSCHRSWQKLVNQFHENTLPADGDHLSFFAGLIVKKWIQRTLTNVSY